MTTTDTAVVDHELDATGLNCPLPVLKAGKKLRQLATGEVLRLLSSDPGSVADIASFCTQTGHELLGSRQQSGVYEFLIRKV